MAKILCAGGRLDSVAVTGTVTEITTAGYFDSTYADNALSLASTSDNWTMTFRDTSNAAVDVVTGETLYGHIEYNALGTSTVASVLYWVFLNSSNQPWLSMQSTNTAGGITYGIYYNSNTGASPTWTLIGSTFTLTNATRYALDMKLTLGSPHSVEFSINGVSTVTGTFTQASLTALRSMRGTGGGRTPRFSQLMATEGISTIGGKVRYSRPTAAGTNSAWTGAYTNVNEAVDNTATLDSTAAANNKQTYAMGDVTVPAGYVIKSVFHALYAKNDGAAPANIKSVLRSGGTDYVAASNLAGIGTSFASLIERYDSDPATATTFTQSGFNALEAGYRSET